MQEVFLTPHHLGIAMEYVDGGDLAQWVQMHRIPDVRTFLLSALQAAGLPSCLTSYHVVCLTPLRSSSGYIARVGKKLQRHMM